MTSRRRKIMSSGAMPDGLVVEVLGLSCAGKTTLVDGIAPLLQAQVIGLAVVDIDPRRPMSRRHRAVAMLAGYANLAFLRWALVNPQRSLTRRALEFSYAIRTARTVHAEARRRRITLVDEGPMKRFATLAEGSRRPDLLARSIPRPDLALHVECDFGARLSRLRTTGRSHAVRRTDAELWDNHEFRTRGNRRLLRTMGVPVLDVDTTDGRYAPGPAAEAIAELCRRRPD
jgi:hypothetical protein